MGHALEDAFGWATEEALGLDWGGALTLLAVGLLVAGVAVAVGMSVAYYLGHGPLATGGGGALAAAGVRRWHRARETADLERWLCGRCRSWNVPSAEACYRGCGPRDVVRMLLPGDVRRPEDAGDGEGVEGAPTDLERPF
jgi:hypothetical protein